MFIGGDYLKTLREAKKIAEKLTDKKIPKETTLRDWKSMGVISNHLEIEERGQHGRRSLFYDEFPAELAAVAELKANYKLKDIGKVRKQLMKSDKHIATEFIMQKINADKLLQKAIDAENEEKKWEIISRIKDLKELTELREDYVDVYLKKEEKLKEEVSI